MTLRSRHLAGGMDVDGDGTVTAQELMHALHAVELTTPEFKHAPGGWKAFAPR